MQLSTTLGHLIRSALLHIPGLLIVNCKRTNHTEMWKERKIISGLVSPSSEWHLHSLPGSQHDPRPRFVSPFPRHLFLWTSPACQQDSLTKAGVKRGLGLPGGSISGIHPPGEEEGLMQGGSNLPAISSFACQCNLTEKTEKIHYHPMLSTARTGLTDCQCNLTDRKDALPSNAIDNKNRCQFQCNPTEKTPDRKEALPCNAIDKNN